MEQTRRYVYFSSVSPHHKWNGNKWLSSETDDRLAEQVVSRPKLKTGILKLRISGNNLQK